MTLTIDKAIKILEHAVTYRDCFDDTDRYHALRLGIEALRAFKYYRSLGFSIKDVQLPGETEE